MFLLPVVLVCGRRPCRLHAASIPDKRKDLRVPCTGRVDVISLLKALEEGADGVFVSGCLLGDCHYVLGNHRATKRVAYVKKLVETIGLNPERVEMFYNSSAMGPQFAQCCRDFTNRIRLLGPSGVSPQTGC